jgi:carboxymethylenebutenolidase
MPDQLIEITIDGSRCSARLSVPDAGTGPGLVVFPDISDDQQVCAEYTGLYAAEGYVVLCPDPPTARDGAENLSAFVEALRGRAECTGKVGAIGFGAGGKLAFHAAAAAGVDCAISYYGVGIDLALDLAPRIQCLVILQVAGKDPRVPPEVVARIEDSLAQYPAIRLHHYPEAAAGFDRKNAAGFDRASAGLAHSRSIALLRKTMGPHYDLEALWDKHTAAEFMARDAAATMRTMVAEPYVNHIPVMTGGVGGRDLARFYAQHFIPKCPADFKLVPISRTIGAERLVDEMLVCFAHDVEIDWMLPGVPPTGRYVEVPTVAIVNFRGDKLYHEHIYWDQATVLVQIGLLDPNGLPVAGVESAKKLLDERLPSNTLMQRWSENAPKRAG